MAIVIITQSVLAFAMEPTYASLSVAALLAIGT
jgi:hypothetical protein